MQQLTARLASSPLATSSLSGPVSTATYELRSPGFDHALRGNWRSQCGIILKLERDDLYTIRSIIKLVVADDIWTKAEHNHVFYSHLGGAPSSSRPHGSPSMRLLRSSEGPGSASMNGHCCLHFWLADSEHMYVYAAVPCKSLEGMLRGGGTMRGTAMPPPCSAASTAFGQNSWRQSEPAQRTQRWLRAYSRCPGHRLQSMILFLFGGIAIRILSRYLLVHVVAIALTVWGSGALPSSSFHGMNSRLWCSDHCVRLYLASRRIAT